MSLTYSTMLPIGTQAPDFRLTGIDDKWYTLADFEGAKALVIVFMCNHCPYVIAVRDKIKRLQENYNPRGVKVAGINSNDAVNYPEDNFANMKKYAQEYEYNFPYLYDQTQDVAKAYSAACTPDFFLFNQDKKLVYRGRLFSPPEEKVNELGFLEAIKESTMSFYAEQDLVGAINAVLEGGEILADQKPSMGCNIKWK